MSRSPVRADGLVVDGLRVDSEAFGIDIVAEVSFAAARGSSIGLVGESGCGKTTVAMALLGYARPGTRIAGGSVRVGDVDVLTLADDALQRVRGRLVSFVPQNPSRALSPGMRVSSQLEEMVARHRPGDPADELVRRACEAAQLPSDREFLDRYPHQLSGGQQQRIAIAMALVCEPEVIVMDEPTTGLDVVTQARLIDVIARLRSEHDATIVYISHDLGVVRNLVDSVCVMYGGRLVESGPVNEVFTAPRHPYTRRLLEAIPRVRGRRRRPRGIPGSAVEPWNRPQGCPFAPRCEFSTDRAFEEMPPPEVEGGRMVRCWRWQELALGAPAPQAAAPARADAAPAPDGAVLSILDLVATYRRRRSRLTGKGGQETVAVAGVSLAVPRGSCLAVVGESGSGKTTLARCIAGLHAPDSGEIRLDGVPLAARARGREKPARRRIQIVFQDPDSSLNPRMNVGQLVARPLRLFYDLKGRAERERVAELLELVRLPATFARRLPSELSGGEKQRVALARALGAQPDLLVCDEVTSALDVAVQASILDLLKELRGSLGMSMLFISHDLGVVRTIADRIVVMRDGVVREEGATEDVYERPADEYTRALLAAIPDLRTGDYPALAEDDLITAS